MAYARISGQVTGTQRAGSSGAAITLTFPSSTTTGNLLVAIITTSGVGVTVTDNKGNTWTQAVSHQFSVPEVQVWYCANATGGASHTVTITPSASAFMSAVIDEYSGEQLTTPVEVTGTAGASSSTFSSGSVTTTNAGDLYITACGCDSSNTTLSSSGAGFTNGYSHPATSNQEGIGYAFEIGGAAGTYSNTWASGAGVAYSGVIVAFKSAAVGGGTITESVSQSMSLVQTATGIKEVHVSVSQSLSLSQSASNNIKVVSVSQSLALNQTLDKRGPVYVTVAQTLPLLQHPSSGGDKTVGVSDKIHLTDKVSRTIHVSVSQSLGLTQNGERSTKIHDVLNLIQTITVGKGAPDVSHALNLSQTVHVNAVTSHALADVMALKESVNYYLIKSNFRCQYSPYIGFSLDTTYPTPSPTPPTLGSATLTLTYPFTSPTTTLVLRNPDWGNRNQLAFSRIYRQSRGGTLIVFADPTWPKQQTLLIQVEALTPTQFANLKSFLAASLGQEIGLLDWENRQWRGVIMNPDTALVQNGRDNRTVSLTFQGKLA